MQYPDQVITKFLDAAKSDASNLQELRKQVVIESQKRAANIIQDMDEWEQSLGKTLAQGQGVITNQQAKKAKNQIIQEVTQKRIAQTQSINDAITDNQSWRSSLEKAASQEPVFEVDGKALSRTQINTQLQNISNEAKKLHTINQVDVTPVQTPEEITRKQLLQTYRERIDAIAKQMRDIQKQLGQINQEINKRQQAINQGRRALPTGKLEAQKRQLEGQLSQLMNEVSSLDELI